MPIGYRGAQRRSPEYRALGRGGPLPVSSQGARKHAQETRRSAHSFAVSPDSPEIRRVPADKRSFGARGNGGLNRCGKYGDGAHVWGNSGVAGSRMVEKKGAGSPVLRCQPGDCKQAHQKRNCVCCNFGSRCKCACRGGSGPGRGRRHAHGSRSERAANDGVFIRKPWKDEAPIGPRGMAVVPPERSALLDGLLPEDDTEAATARVAHHRAIQMGGLAAAREIVENLSKRRTTHPV